MRRSISLSWLSTPVSSKVPPDLRQLVGEFGERLLGFRNEHEGPLQFKKAASSGLGQG
jgi:hypothetical protein